jgi:transposase
VGRSRGGRTIKIHAVVDKQGQPINLKLTAGQDADITSAPEVIADLPEGAWLLADKGYDSNALREMVANRKAWANIPLQSSRKDLIYFSKHVYRACNRVERLFNKIKQ